MTIKTVKLLIQRAINVKLQFMYACDYHGIHLSCCWLPTFIPGVPKKVHNFVQVLCNLETRYMNKLCLVSWKLQHRFVHLIFRENMSKNGFPEIS